MFPGKKSLLLLFFLGPFPFFFCDQERGADEEEGKGEKEIKRTIFSVFKNWGKVGGGFGVCKFNKQC
uniref:Ranatuerin-1Cd antimicrobial peptide n=1 Tax=Aquarana catesbeiana TaxID=8400 RepID=C5IAZ7_AQUCT|nr:ranatuerin-1Cd antimicrobial peptide precursor [Aquarana catesbeiana]